MTDRRPTLTDREAIRRLATIVARQATFRSDRDAVYDLIREIDEAEPAAPTVTREQAERFVNLLLYNEGIIGTMDCPAREPSAVGEVPMKERCWACRIGVCEVVDGESWPAFFRAVADALEDR